MSRGRRGSGWNSSHESASVRQALIWATLLLAAAGAAEPQHHALLGSWDYDASRSTFDGGIPYRSGTIRLDALPTGIRVVAHIVEGTGRVLHFEYVDPGDGRFVRVDGNPFYDSESTRWSAGAAVRTERRDGKIIGTTRMEVDADGGAFLARADRTRPDGLRYVSVIAWTRAAKH